MKKNKDKDEAIVDKETLPAYASILESFHKAFYGELRAITHSVPINPHQKILDMSCGDGFYTQLLAEKLGKGGSVTGIDPNEAFLSAARKRLSKVSCLAQIKFIDGDLDTLKNRKEKYDLIWCAQSLFSLPDPHSAIKAMARALEPTGFLAILENDCLHQVLLPWPAHLELALRTAELKLFEEESANPQKFYVGRRLPALLAQAGLTPLFFRTQVIDRSAPLTSELEFFLVHYLKDLSEKVSPHLKKELREEFSRLTSPKSKECLYRQPYFTLSWVNVLSWAKLGPKH